jgi:hypothetical protein
MTAEWRVTSGSMRLMDPGVHVHCRGAETQGLAIHVFLRTGHASSVRSPTLVVAESGKTLSFWAARPRRTKTSADESS